MPGTVVQLRVEPGATVSAGETLVVLESMKMEISIAAPRDGSVAEVFVARVALAQPFVLGIALLTLFQHRGLALLGNGVHRVEP